MRACDVCWCTYVGKMSYIVFDDSLHTLDDVSISFEVLCPHCKCVIKNIKQITRRSKFIGFSIICFNNILHMVHELLENIDDKVIMKVLMKNLVNYIIQNCNILLQYPKFTVPIIKNLATLMEINDYLYIQHKFKVIL